MIMSTDTSTIKIYEETIQEVPSAIKANFDSSCSSWSPELRYNEFFLRAQQQYANDLLRVRGHMFLNEIYDSVGLPRTRLGALVGWTHPSTIDFGVIQQDDAFSLTFNIDGVIWNLI